jgi:hypothetical protein
MKKITENKCPSSTGDLALENIDDGLASESFVDGVEKILARDMSAGYDDLCSISFLFS